MKFNLKTVLRPEFERRQRQRPQPPPPPQPPPEPKIVGAYHIAILNNWEEIVDCQTKRIIDSGLLDCTDKIFIGVVGGSLDLNHFDPRIAKKAVVFCDPVLEHFEFPTLKILRDFSVGRDFKAWYIHTKGVSRPGNKSIKNWRILMEYFIIDRYKHCIKVLDNNDACGIQCHRGVLKTHHGSTLHFSGNFWWANSTYLCRLPKIEDLDWSNRFDAEAWIGEIIEDGMIVGEGKLRTFFNYSHIHNDMQMLNIDMKSIIERYPI